jgi:hypothetical protein
MLPARPVAWKKYPRLARYLEALPADQASVRLSFAELEGILGGPLSLSARQAPYWSYVLARHWRPLGFTAKLDRLDGAAVTFTRTVQL